MGQLDVSVSPPPLSWEPSQHWDGIDGKWSSFPLRVGNPTQLVRVLISTAGQATGVVIVDGCPSKTTDCEESRGGLFNPNSSNTWKPQGNYTLGLEANNGYGDITAMYGYDTLSLGLSKATGGPSLKSQVVAGLVSQDFKLGLFGLGNQPTNFTGLDDSHPSFLTNLKAKNLIPSLSWSYTAGAYYNKSFGSLTFGGYDLSKFIPNNVTFFLAGDISRDIVVNLQRITSTDSTNSFNSFLQSPISTFIDSTIPFIYLPADACKRFEEQFGLVWNSSLGLYLVGDELHKNLSTSNLEFKFQLGNSTNDEPTVDINLPYASFDLILSPPDFVDEDTRYFPIRRGNESQYVLGRTFLQEAYLTVNYEHSNFSISQRKVQGDPKPDLIAIGPANNKPVTPVAPVPVPSNRPSAQAHLSLGAILGFSIGVALFLILVSGIITFITWKRRSLRLQEVNRRRLSDSSPPKNLPSLASFSTQEIDNNSGFWGYYEVPDTKKAELQDHQTSNNPHLYFRELQIDRLSGDLQYRTQDLLHTEISELMAQSIRSGRVTRMGTTTTKTVTKASVRSVSGASSPRTENFKTDGIESCGLPMSHRCAPCEKTFISSVRCVSLNLNRPLPPTPISVTPRVLSTTIPPERIEI